MWRDEHVDGLTEQQQLELPTRVAFVASQLALDLLVDALLLLGLLAHAARHGGDVPAALSHPQPLAIICGGPAQPAMPTHEPTHGDGRPALPCTRQHFCKKVQKLIKYFQKLHVIFNTFGQICYCTPRKKLH